ncbi:peptidyl-tRNA hydrolase PTH2-domain-containing protein [Halenospora varia]|nr:peptidyl-tRNA hydrolase PTH2-domain-containing protein [Halenospora varia]
MADRPGPTLTAMLVGTVIISGLTGYMIGLGSSLGFFPTPFKSKTPTTRGVSNYDDEEESSEEDIDEDILDHAPNWSNGVEADRRDGLKVEGRSKSQKTESAHPDWRNSKEDCKMVLIVRTDLGMTKGKIAAQCSHATLACYKNFLRNDPQSPILRRWEREGQMKVALQVKSDEDLALLQATALSLGLVAEVIADAGKTQIASGSHTVLGIGPAPMSVIDKVTGTLRLL